MLVPSPGLLDRHTSWRPRQVCRGMVNGRPAHNESSLVPLHAVETKILGVLLVNEVHTTPLAAVISRCDSRQYRMGSAWVGLTSTASPYSLAGLWGAMEAGGYIRQVGNVVERRVNERRARARKNPDNHHVHHTNSLTLPCQLSPLPRPGSASCARHVRIIRTIGEVFCFFLSHLIICRPSCSCAEA